MSKEDPESVRQEIEGPVVETSSGKVRGRTTNGVHVFKGIRYARAERFMPPVPVEPWSGIQEAETFGAIAPQTDPAPPSGPPYVILAQLPRPATPSTPAVENEDCLFLNVWASADAEGARRPVMVWLHGGFFYGGSGNGVDGSALAAHQEVVVISLNHRLNAFGFCHLADMGGPDFAHSGNAGMLDIVAALKWVRENIAAFGGDPDKITLFGTSGGGMKACFLASSPASRDLIARAAVQSGPGIRFMERDQATLASELLLRELKLNARDLDALRTVETTRLLAAYHRVARTLQPRRFIDLPCFSPVIDPDILPCHPFSPEASPLIRDVPMLVGWNADEMSFFMGRDPEGFELDEAGFKSRVSRMFNDTGAAASLYRNEFPEKSFSDLYIRAYSDVSLMLPVVVMAERKAATPGGVWLYRLDHPSPALGGKLGALHTMETPLIFNTTSTNPLTAGDNAALPIAAKMSAAWARFAATGSPQFADGTGEWPVFEASRRATMVLDSECRIEENGGSERLKLLRPLLDL
jgi:para-nitrobenzyl esterase